MRAIVTGAASGIGRATARALADAAAARGEDCGLLLVDRDATGTRALAEELGCATSLSVDLADPTAGARVAAAAGERLGGLDALISNAGVVGTSALVDLPLEEWERTFAVNVRATWLLARSADPLLAEAHGALVATASIAAREPAPPMGAYGPSKAALVMLSNN